MNKQQKHEHGKVLKDSFSKAQVAVFLDYRGMKAADADQFRKLVRDNGGKAQVIKNNVARMISKDDSLGTEVKDLMNGLVGPTLVAFGFDDPVSVSKVVHNFTKDNEQIVLRDSLMGQKRITPAEVEALASLPSREVLLAKILGSLNAPVTNFVGVLAAVPRSMMNVLNAISAKKGE